jgi:hypothetical protein
MSVTSRSDAQRETQGTRRVWGDDDDDKNQRVTREKDTRRHDANKLPITNDSVLPRNRVLKRDVRAVGL